VKTLLTAFRVVDLEHSADFYEKLGFEEVGRVDVNEETTLAMFCMPDDGDFVRLELVFNRGVDSYEVGDGFSHLAVSVDDIHAKVAELDGAGIGPETPPYQPGEGTPWICFLRDPDGYRIELVEFPEGHPEGVVRADFARG
jgi:lactoylglutathione lyase